VIGIEKRRMNQKHSKTRSFRGRERKIHKGCAPILIFHMRLLCLFATILLCRTPTLAEGLGCLTTDGRPVVDAVVFVHEPAGAAGADVKPSTVVMDQVNKEFVPHVLPIIVGTKVEFPNHDQIHHHVYSFSRTRMFEIPLYKGEAASPIVFDKEGAVKIGCNIHDWMSAVILVLPTPLFAKTGADGAFRIDGVPSGRHPVAVWHERSRYRG
jgi:plastocyanin